MTEEYEYDLIQDGAPVAGAWSKNKERALQEIWHYAKVYSQDGPVKILQKKPVRKVIYNELRRKRRNDR